MNFQITGGYEVSNWHHSVKCNFGLTAQEIFLGQDILYNST